MYLEMEKNLGASVDWINDLIRKEETVKHKGSHPPPSPMPVSLKVRVKEAGRGLHWKLIMLVPWSQAAIILNYEK